MGKKMGKTKTLNNKMLQDVFKSRIGDIKAKRQSWLESPTLKPGS